MDFIKKTLNVFKNKYAGLALEFITHIFLVRYLGAENYGKYTVLYILPILVTSFGSFGFGPSIIYYTNKIRFETSQYLGTFTLLGLILGFFYVSIILFFLPFIDVNFYNNRLNIDLFFISIFFIPIMIVQKYLRAVVRGMYKIKIFTFLIDLMLPLSRLILVSIFINLDLGLKSIVYIPIIAQGFITFSFFIYLFKNSKIHLNNLFLSKSEFVIITKFAFKNYFGSALQKSNETLIILIASTILTFEEVGLLALAKKLLQFLIGTSNSILTVIMPKISKSTADQIKIYIPKLTSILFSFSIISVILYLYFLEDLIKIIYGNEFIKIAKLSIPLSLIAIFLPIANILLTTLTFTGDPMKKFYARGFGLIVNLILFYPLYLLYGAFGFALSIGIAQLLIFILSLFFYMTKFNEYNLYKLLVANKIDIKYLFTILKQNTLFKWKI